MRITLPCFHVLIDGFAGSIVQAIALPLSAARIGNDSEALWQRAHLFGMEHDLGGSRQLKVIPVGVGQS